MKICRASNCDRKAHASRRDGEHNPCAKLTENMVFFIRLRRAEGCPKKALAAWFGIGDSTVWNIHKGHTWPNVKVPIRS